MNSRQNVILSELLKTGYNEYITGNELAEKLQISVKTLQKEMKELMSTLREKDIEIISSTRRGYRLAPYSMDQYQFMNSQLIKPEDNERQLSAAEIIISLLKQEDYVRVSDLAEELYYSESKLNKDLQKVKEILKESRLFLEHRPYKGIRIIGEEADIRSMILSNGLYYQGLFEAEKERKETMEILTEVVMEVLTRNRYLLSDITLQNLLLNLYVSLLRSQQGHLISIQNETREIIAAHVLGLSQQIAAEIEEKRGLHLPYAEKEYLSLYLQSEKSSDDTQAITEEIEEMITGMFLSIREKNGIDLTSDYELFMSLAAHIKPMLLRINYHFEVKNPIFSQITANYPLAYDLALTGANYLYDVYNIRLSRDEISYLGVYFALSLEKRKESGNKKKVLVISSERKGNTMIMRFMLMKRFESLISELDFINISDYKPECLKGYDAVFTMAGSYDLIPKDIPRINYFISSVDYRIIEKQLNSSKQKMWFEDFFDVDLLIINRKYSDKLVLLKDMVRLAAEKYPNLKEDDLLASILKREENGFTYFDHGLAIPHPDKMIDNKESFVVAAILPEELQWKPGENVSIIFLVCINSDAHEGYQAFYKGVTSLIGNDVLCQRLKECHSFDSFYKTIKEAGEKDY